MIVSLAATGSAYCPTTMPVTLSPPKCADYPDGYFINDYTDCQAYFFCPSAKSPPHRGKCLDDYNFDQTRQICNHPDEYPCALSYDCVAEAGKLTDFVTMF